MREWLTVIIILLILGILLDGWRRMRNARRDNIKMPRSVYKSQASASAPGTDQYTSELPNGGARVVGFRTSDDPERADPAFAEPAFDDSDPSDFADPSGSSEKHRRFEPDDEDELEESPSAAFHNQARTDQHAGRASESGRIPQQVTLNLDESVPMLMESVEEDGGDEDQSAYGKQEQKREDPQASPYRESFPSADERIEPTLGAGSAKPSRPAPKAKAPSTPPPEDDLSGPEVEPEEVLIINVMAHSGCYFQGEDLLKVIFDCGLRYGSMSIFHRYRDARGGGPVLFSLANMVKPGTFDLDAMGEFQTPGVSLFMTLPMEGDSVPAFDLMLDTAKTLAEALDGELKDENRSVMTRQTMEHDRQRVLEFVRRQLSRVPG